MIKIIQTRTSQVIYEGKSSHLNHKITIGDAMRTYTGSQLNIKFHPAGDHIAQILIGNTISDSIPFSIEYEED